MPANPPSAPPRLRVWDLPTRLFHWALAVSIIGAIVSVNIGGDAMAWHFRFGYAVLTLLLFRVIWGFVGPRYARFSSFPPRLGAAWRSLRDPGSGATQGHSASAALSVYALLIVAGIQVVTGLFSNDAIIWEGPLRNWISSDQSDMITGWHLRNRFALIGLIALHLLAIVWWRVRHGKRLTRAMITGDADRISRSDEPALDGAAVRIRALVVLALAAVAVSFLVR
jgi:cytochrome b